MPGWGDRWRNDGAVGGEVSEGVTFAEVFRDHYARVMRLAFLASVPEAYGLPCVQAGLSPYQSAAPMSAARRVGVPHEGGGRMCDVPVRVILE